ncbi:hypothetical protein [Vampirovibrio sp.]|uniref:hypothetical protein n=1 Tax=Vampirovibrio sp. TaxID=2717857 RepID=UPI0035947E34
MGNLFPSSQVMTLSGFRPQPTRQRSALTQKQQAPLAAPKAYLLSGLKPLHADFQRFGTGSLNALADDHFQGKGASAAPVFQKTFYTKDEPDLLKPKGQILRLSDAMKEALAAPQDPMPEQVVLNLVYEDMPPVAGIRAFLAEKAEEANGKSVKLMGARLFMGMPKQLPPMALKHDPADAKAITFAVDTRHMSRDELMQFANFLAKGARFLPEAYQE